MDSRRKDDLRFLQFLRTAHTVVEFEVKAASTEPHRARSSSAQAHDGVQANGSTRCDAQARGGATASSNGAAARHAGGASASRRTAARQRHAGDTHSGKERERRTQEVSGWIGPPKGSSGSRGSPEQLRPPPGPELRGQVGSAPSALTGEELPASGEAFVTRVALAQPPSGSSSASAEKARRGSSSWPTPGKAPEPLLEMLGSAREVIGRLETAIAADRTELEEECAALVDERGRLEEARKLLETRVSMARTAHEGSLQELAMKWEALEEVCEEAVAAQKEAEHLEELTALRDQASKERAGKLATREVQLALREQEVASREEAVSKREEASLSTETDLHHQAQDLKCGRADVLYQEEQVALREMDANLASSALAAREKSLANQEARVTAREQAIEAWAEQLERARTEVATQLQEARAMKDVPASNKGLEARLNKADEDLNAVREERTHVKAMMQDVLRQATAPWRRPGSGPGP
ncbi:golgin-84-like [Phragmites australis]|uniref:golgin-84-like n=1 Tax=Phragmites australis TaxID=29695 RepID=UPI002D781E29|nr:golgin-84-like [Phragmites australis]